MLKNLCIILAIWGIVYLQHSVVGYYHDDYAYAGLTYVYDVGGPYAERLTAENLFSFLHQLYMSWGGRVIPFIFALPVMHCGPAVFWFVQSAIVTAIILLSSRYASLAAPGGNFPACLLLNLSFYMSWKICLVRESVYWATASTLYVWPFLALILLFGLLRKRLFSTWAYLGAFALSFIVAGSHESYAILLLAYETAMFALNCHFKRSPQERSWFCLAGAASGAAFCLLAPGNFIRASLFPHQTIQDIGTLYREIPAAFLWFFTNFFNFIPTLFIIAAILAIPYFLKNTKKYMNFLALYIACTALFAILLLPAARTPRVLIPIFLLLPIVASPFLVSALRNINPVLRFIILAAVLGYSLDNYLDIRRGYAANFPVLQQNDAILSGHDHNAATCHLNKLPDDKYAADMPYQPGKDYILIFMKRYYDLPFETEILYSSPAESFSLIVETPGTIEFKDLQATAHLKILAASGDSPLENVRIQWNVQEAENLSSAIVPGWRNKKSGLAWGQHFKRAPESELDNPSVTFTDHSGHAQADLTDIMGERNVFLQITATLGDRSVQKVVTVHFGPGPLARFSGPPPGRGTWTQAAEKCSGTAGKPFVPGYQKSTLLPTTKELQDISGQPHGWGALYAAGWPNDHYWSGDSEGSGKHAMLVSPGAGHDVWGVITNEFRYACLR